MRCVECGAPAAEGTQLCARCGAPVSGPLVAVDPLAGGLDDLETASAPARVAKPWPAAVRWFFLICLVLCLILFTISQVGVVRTSPGTPPHGMMVAVSWLGIVGALFFLVLFECARKQFAQAQLWWAVVPPMSFGLLASVPFLWLAVLRRRVRDWVVFAVYLAASITVVVALSSVPSNTSIHGVPAVILSLLLVIAPVHAWLAFSPAARPPTWREAYPGWSLGKRQESVTDAVPAQDRNPDAGPGYPEPTLTDLSSVATRDS